MKQDLPQFYEKMMQKMWEEYWVLTGKVHRTIVFLRVVFFFFKYIFFNNF